VYGIGCVEAARFAFAVSLLVPLFAQPEKITEYNKTTAIRIWWFEKDVLLLIKIVLSKRKCKFET